MEAKTEASAPQPSDAPNRILLVDDNLTNLQVLYQALEHEGYELLVAQSGEEALEIAERAAPSVIRLWKRRSIGCAARWVSVPNSVESTSSTTSA